MPRSKLMKTISQRLLMDLTLTLILTEHYRPILLHYPPGLIPPQSNHSHQSHLLSQSRLHSSIGNLLTAKRVNQKRQNPARPNPKREKLKKKAEVQQWPKYLRQRRWIRETRGTAVDQTAVTMNLMEDPVKPVGPNTGQRAPVKTLQHSLWLVAPHRTVHCEVDWSNMRRTDQKQPQSLFCCSVWL